jgi:hypothetical protein
MVFKFDVLLVGIAIAVIVFLGICVYISSPEGPEKTEPLVVVPAQSAGNKSKAKKKKAKPANSDAAKPSKAPKPRNLHKTVPQGKSAFCKFCEVYMDDDEQLANHTKGKKHLKYCKKDTENWYNLTDRQEKETSFKTEPVLEEIEDGWTL